MSARDVVAVSLLDVWRLPMRDRPDAILSALAASGYAVVPRDLPGDLDGIRQRIGMTRDQYARIILAIEAAQHYDRAMLAAAEEPQP